MCEFSALLCHSSDVKATFSQCGNSLAKILSKADLTVLWSNGVSSLDIQCLPFTVYLGATQDMKCLKPSRSTKLNELFVVTIMVLSSRSNRFCDFKFRGNFTCSPFFIMYASMVSVTGYFTTWVLPVTSSISMFASRIWRNSDWCGTRCTLCTWQIRTGEPRGRSSLWPAQPPPTRSLGSLSLGNNSYRNNQYL